MPAPDTASEGYLEAFMNGFEFVLLAMRGRLQETDLAPEERARLEAFIADYWRIAHAYHARTPARPPPGLGIAGRVPIELAPTMAN